MTQEDIIKVRDELKNLFATMQRIDAPMSENNVAVMNACLGSIKYLYNFMDGRAKDGNADAE